MNNNQELFPLFHVPHDGTSFPEELMASVCISQDRFMCYHELMRDKGTLEMVPDPWRNQENTMYFPISRLLCDVERFLGPEESMERLGMGFCYEMAFDGSQIKNVTENLKRETLVYYHRHHEYLNQLCAKHPHILLFDLHSFSDEIIPHNQLRPNQRTPDVCLGVDDRFTPEQLVEIAEDCISEIGLTLARNYPYSGSLVPNSLLSGNSYCDCASIMLEWNKRSYCDKDGTPDKEKIEQIRKTICRIVDVYRKSRGW